MSITFNSILLLIDIIFLILGIYIVKVSFLSTFLISFALISIISMIIYYIIFIIIKKRKLY